MNPRDKPKKNKNHNFFERKKGEEILKVPEKRCTIVQDQNPNKIIIIGGTL